MMQKNGTRLASEQPGKTADPQLLCRTSVYRSIFDIRPADPSKPSLSITTWAVSAATHSVESRSLGRLRRHQAVPLTTGIPGDRPDVTATAGYDSGE